jgi:hypothetical protein
MANLQSKKMSSFMREQSTECREPAPRLWLSTYWHEWNRASAGLGLKTRGDCFFELSPLEKNIFFFSWRMYVSTTHSENDINSAQILVQLSNITRARAHDEPIGQRPHTNSQNNESKRDQ